MPQDDDLPPMRQPKGRVQATARVMGSAMKRSALSDIRRALIFFACLPMVAFAFAPPGEPADNYPDAGAWTCRIIFGTILVAVNFGVLLPDLAGCFREMQRRLYVWAVALIIIGTPVAYVMRLILIDHH
jgi:hypothetical protein